jgi:lipopolysaccharide export LptBFGC system permease protein LptF
LKKKIGSKDFEPSSTFLTGFTENKKENSTFAQQSTLSVPESNVSKIGSKPNFVTSSGFSKKNEQKPAEIAAPKSNDSKKKEQANGFWDFEEIDLDEDDQIAPKVDYQKTNLNKLSKEELDKHKKKMDVVFNKNQKKPGDAEFVYDKQEDFEPKEDNEWDEDF